VRMLALTAEGRSEAVRDLLFLRSAFTPADAA
jgi:hypothetical protein